ncbi:Candidapepsin-8 [Metarhizium anisopliae]|nr:Candidapepsin-8 [Metarhizium anisopliae]
MVSLVITSAVVSLSLSVHGWPQVRNESRFFGEEIRAENIVADMPSRELPVVGETLSVGTLPMPQLSQRHNAAGSLEATQDGQDSSFNSFQQDPKQGPPDGDISPGHLTLPVLHVETRLDKRDVEVRLENRSDVAYYVQRNPIQKVFAQLDTGSFELWVNPDCTNLPASADNRFCQAVGQYNPLRSSSSKGSNLSTELRYGIGSAQVTYFLDDIALVNSRQMKQVQFGVAQSTKDQFSGILGIGHGVGINTGYKNFVDQLADQGITKTKAYSVALGSKADRAGVVVMGGVDTAKFSGRLAPLPLIPGDKSPDGVTRFWIKMKSVQHTPESGRTADLTGATMPVFMDTGATLTLLPPRLANDIARQVGARALGDSGLYTVDCGLASKNGSLDFNFDGVTIRVPYSEMVREVAGLPPSCYLGIMPSTSFALLGDTFLRSAYGEFSPVCAEYWNWCLTKTDRGAVLFDISNNMTYMAPYANCGSRTQSIDSSTDLTSIVGTCSPQQVSELSKPVGSGSPDGNSGNNNKDNGAGSARMSWSWFGVLGVFAMGVLTL